MPPRIPIGTLQSAPIPRLRTSQRSPFHVSAPCCQELTQGRVAMFKFLEELEQRVHERDGGHGCYLGPSPDQPFPLNPQFRSQAVLSEEARGEIWRRAVVDKEPLKMISADLNVDMRRIAAVVRLMEVEKRWVKEGKKLARPYSRAIMSMLPKTDFKRSGEDANEPEIIHESIHDVHLHGHTKQQLFVPTAESRYFTRGDAAKAIHPKMLTPDERVPVPELVDMEKAILNGAGRGESRAQFEEAATKSHRMLHERAKAKARAEQARTKVVDSGRFEFRFKDFDAAKVGRDGRAPNAIGMRYGVPFDDRRAGKIKIPTSVP